MTPAALAALEALVEALCEGEPFANHQECARFWARENELARIMRQERETDDELEV